MLEDRPEYLGRTEEQFHLLSEFEARLLVFLAFLVNAFQVADDDLDVEAAHCAVQAVHEDVVRHADVREEQDHLTVQIALGEGGASDYFEVVILRFELYLARSDLDLVHPFGSELRLRNEDALRAAETHLKGRALVHADAVADHLRECEGEVPAAICEGVESVWVLRVVRLLDLDVGDLGNVFRLQLRDVLGRGEALTAARVHLQVALGSVEGA